MASGGNEKQKSTNLGKTARREKGKLFCSGCRGNPQSVEKKKVRTNEVK